MNWLAIAPWLLSLVLGIGGFTAYEVERGNYQAEVGARAADKIADQQAVIAEQDKAKAASDDAIRLQAERDTARAATTVTYVDRIVHAAPSACPPSDAARASSEFVRSTVTTRPAGGPSTK